MLMQEYAYTHDDMRIDGFAAAAANCAKELFGFGAAKNQRRAAGQGVQNVHTGERRDAMQLPCRQVKARTTYRQNRRCIQNCVTFMPSLCARLRHVNMMMLFPPSWP